MVSCFELCSTVQQSCIPCIISESPSGFSFLVARRPARTAMTQSQSHTSIKPSCTHPQSATYMHLPRKWTHTFFFYVSPSHLAVPCSPQGCGVSVTVLEATDRVGGRCHSDETLLGPGSVTDLGPGLVPLLPLCNPAATLCRQLGLPLLPQTLSEPATGVFDLSSGQPVSPDVVAECNRCVVLVFRLSALFVCLRCRETVGSCPRERLGAAELGWVRLGGLCHVCQASSWPVVVAHPWSAPVPTPVGLEGAGHPPAVSQLGVGQLRVHTSGQRSCEAIARCDQLCTQHYPFASFLRWQSPA